MDLNAVINSNRKGNISKPHLSLKHKLSNNKRLPSNGPSLHSFGRQSSYQHHSYQHNNNASSHNYGKQHKYIVKPPGAQSFYNFESSFSPMDKKSKSFDDINFNKKFSSKSKHVISVTRLLREGYGVHAIFLAFALSIKAFFQTQINKEGVLQKKLTELIEHGKRMNDENSEDFVILMLEKTNEFLNQILRLSMTYPKETLREIVDNHKLLISKDSVIEESGIIDIPYDEIKLNRDLNKDMSSLLLCEHNEKMAHIISEKERVLDFNENGLRSGNDDLTSMDDSDSTTNEIQMIEKFQKHQFKTIQNLTQFPLPNNTKASNHQGAVIAPKRESKIEKGQKTAKKADLPLEDKKRPSTINAQKTKKRPQSRYQHYYAPLNTKINIPSSSSSSSPPPKTIKSYQNEQEDYYEGLQDFSWIESLYKTLKDDKTTYAHRQKEINEIHFFQKLCDDRTYDVDEEEMPMTDTYTKVIGLASDKRFNQSDNIALEEEIEEDSDDEEEEEMSKKEQQQQQQMKNLHHYEEMIIERNMKNNKPKALDIIKSYAKEMKETWADDDFSDFNLNPPKKEINNKKDYDVFSNSKMSSSSSSSSDNFRGKVDWDELSKLKQMAAMGTLTGSNRNSSKYDNGDIGYNNHGGSGGGGGRGGGGGGNNRGGNNNNNNRGDDGKNKNEGGGDGYWWIQVVMSLLIMISLSVMLLYAFSSRHKMRSRRRRPSLVMTTRLHSY